MVSLNRYRAVKRIHNHHIIHVLIDLISICSDTTVPALEDAQINQPCCAQFTEDDSWYRAQILNITEDHEVEVCYVDYGNTETIPEGRLRLLDQEVKDLPAQAVRCMLHGVRPIADTWIPG